MQYRSLAHVSPTNRGTTETQSDKTRHAMKIEAIKLKRERRVLEANRYL